MDITKRFAKIIILIISAMLIIPLITINTVKSDAGMVATLLLFFALNPIVSVWVGILSGKDVKHFWFTPILIAILFWMFSSLTYQTAFPAVYSMVYLIISAVSMLVSWLVSGK